MMKQRKSVQTDLETIIPLLVGTWRRLHKESGPPDLLQTREFRRVVSAVKVLEGRFQGEKGSIGNDYFTNPEFLGAYLLYHWVIHYLQGVSLIGELPIVPRRVLDLCSGPSPFSFAALKHGAGQVFAMDLSKKALEIGAEVCGRYGFPLDVRQGDCLQGEISVEGKFDLIILGHCLEELFPKEDKSWNHRQYDFVFRLLQRLTPNGFLLVVERSQLDPNQRVLSLRDRLVKEGIPIQAPCVWRGECPALKAKNSPCYAQREFEKPYLIKEIQRASQINLSSLKMSYVIFKSPEATWPALPEKPLYRVISPPVESYHGTRYYLCGTEGKKHLGSRVKEHSKESRAFEYLRRGELISIENALEKDQALDIVVGTSVTVESACGKPLSGKE